MYEDNTAKTNHESTENPLLQAIDAVAEYVEATGDISLEDISFEALIAKADALTSESPPDEIRAILEQAVTLDHLSKRRLMERIKQTSGMPIGEQKIALKEGNEVSEEADHLALARQIIDDIGRENLLATVAHVWQWKEYGVWKPVPDLERKQLVQLGLENLGCEVTRQEVDSVAEVLRTAIYAPGHEWDTHCDSINFKNGELFYEQGQWVLKPHCREHHRTTQIPHPYQPEAKCPRFIQFLREIFTPDADGIEKATLVAELIGYTLVSHARFEVFILLIGSGANGKSVLLDIIRVMLGSANVAAVQPSQFTNRFQRAHLHLKLANLVTEIAEGAEISDAELKAIVSGELTTAEHKFQPPFDFRPYCTCWFGTNHLPHTRDFSDALFRRAMVIPFNRVFKHGVDANPNLKDELAEEIPGIINLALQAFAKVIERGGHFTQPASCVEAKHLWRLEADQVAQFVGDVCILSPDVKETSRNLYEAYQHWAGDAGIARKLNRKNFANRLERLGAKPHKGTGGTRMIAGIRLKDAGELGA